MLVGDPQYLPARAVQRDGHGGDPAAITTAAPVATATSGRLVLETTAPVAAWTVQVRGQAVPAAVSTPQRWEGEVAGDPATIFIATEAADPTSTAAIALRWRLAGRSGMLWGEGAVSGTLAGVVR